MAPAVSADRAPVPPPSYHRAVAMALHLDALTLVRRLQLLTLCELAVQLAQRQCPPPLPAGPGGAPRLYAEDSLLLLALLRTLWRLSYQEPHDWICAWPALALACGLPLGADGRPRVPSKAQQSRRLRAAGAPASVHDAPFARPLLELAVRLFAVRPRVIRLDAGYWGVKLIAWLHAVLGAAAVIPWNPKRQKQRDGLPPTWTAAELGKRTSIERFFGRALVFFRLRRPPVFGWSAVETRVALTYAAVWVIALSAWQAGRPDLIRSPRLVLAHVWEGVEV